MNFLAIEAPPVSHPTVDYCGRWYCQFSWDSLLSSAIAIAITMAVVLVIASRSRTGLPGWLQLGPETPNGFVRGRPVRRTWS